MEDDRVFPWLEITWIRITVCNRMMDFCAGLVTANHFEKVSFEIIFLAWHNSTRTVGETKLNIAFLPVFQHAFSSTGCRVILHFPALDVGWFSIFSWMLVSKMDGGHKLSHFAGRDEKATVLDSWGEITSIRDGHVQWRYNHLGKYRIYRNIEILDN